VLPARGERGGTVELLGLALNAKTREARAMACADGRGEGRAASGIFYCVPCAEKAWCIQPV
jgi:hypothetical protein